jgi:hypothetical protein
MTISATDVRFDADKMWVTLEDGRVIGVPMTWFPRLMAATEEERADVQFSAFGLHWSAIDEDISVPGLLEGRGANENAA